MTQHIVDAAFAKVAIGSPTGNRVARILRRGDVVPDGVTESQIEHLVARGLISEVKVETPSTPSNRKRKAAPAVTPAPAPQPAAPAPAPNSDEGNPADGTPSPTSE